MHSIESYLDRKERLRGEGKVELPLNIDTKKYLFWRISFQDLLIISPFLLFTVIVLVILYLTENLSRATFFLAILPPLVVGMFQLQRHPVRKDVSFIQYGFIDRYKFQKRNKTFKYSKGEIMQENMEDVRLKLGIKNIFSGCYETTDNRFVKVLEISSINLSMMNKTEQDHVYDSYQSFLKELTATKEIQIEQIAQPVNLGKYLVRFEEKTKDQKNIAKRMLIRSYIKFTENIQQSKNMVSHSRYVIVSHPIGSDREKALEEVERKAKLVQTSINNMLSGSQHLQAKILKNDELIKLIYNCIDYDNAQALGDHIVNRSTNYSNISLGELTAKKIVETYTKQLEEKIN